MRAKANYHHRIKRTSLKIHNHILECTFSMLPIFPFLKKFVPTLPRKNHHNKKLSFAFKNPRVESTSRFFLLKKKQKNEIIIIILVNQEVIARWE